MWTVLKITAFVFLAFRCECWAKDYDCRSPGVFGPLNRTMDLPCWGWGNKCQYVICSSYNATSFYPSYRQCPTGTVFVQPAATCTACPVGTTFSCLDSCTCSNGTATTPPTTLTTPTPPVVTCSSNFPGIDSNPYGPARPVSSGGSCISCSAYNASTPRWTTANGCVTCPKNRPVYNSLQNTCIADRCVDSGEFWHSKLNDCVKCPTKESGCAAVGNQLACATWNGEYCTEPKPNLGGHCPTTFPGFPEQAGPGRPFNNGGRCEACPADTPKWNNSQKRCVACGNAKPLYNSFTNECLPMSECPSPFVWQSAINEFKSLNQLLHHLMT